MKEPVREHLLPTAGRIRAAVRMVGTQEEVAQQIGVSATAMKRYVSARGEPLPSTLVRLAALADVDLTWLLTGEGPVNRGILQKRVAELEAELVAVRKPAPVSLSTAWNALSALGAIVRGEKLP